MISSHNVPLEIMSQHVAISKPPRFTKISAEGKRLPADAQHWEAVVDQRTGLMWTVAEKKVTSHAKAEAAVKKMTAAGHKDWRLPTVEELFALADRIRMSPAIDTDYFPDCKSDWYWTATPYAGAPAECAWGVGFYYGGSAYCYYRDDYGFVRAVRGGQF